MIRLDSSKIELPIDVLESFNKSLFFEDIKKRDGIELSKKWTVTDVMSGLNYIEVNEGQEKVRIGVSAKILLDDYYEGINIDTIARVFDVVNKSGLIEVNVNRSIDEGKFYNIDVTTNLEPKEKAGKYIDALQVVSTINGKYKVDAYKQVGKNEGIVLSGTQKSFKEREIFYYKKADLLKSDNKKFLQELKSPAKLLDQHNGTLRCESNNAQLRMIRKRCGVADTNILDILESQRNVNYDLFCKITSPIIQLDLFSDQYEGMSLHQVEKIEGRKRIIIASNYDIELIKIFIARHIGVKSNIYGYLKEYKELMYNMRCGEDADYEYINLVNELSDLLKVA